jgi:hypothetical protein
MSSQHSIHVCFQTEVGVDGSLVKFYFNKTVRVSSNDKVDFCPINHNDLLDIVHNVGQLLFGDSLHAPVHLGRLELASENLIFLNPL